MESLLSRYPALSALLTANAERAHVLLGPIEFALMAEGDARIRQVIKWATALSLNAEELLPQIPQIPATILQSRGNLNLLTLVPFHLGNVQLAKAAGLKHEEYGYTDETLIPADPRYADLPTTWAWVLAHDGSPNLGRKPTDCLAQCTGGLYAGVDKVGVAIWLIHGPRKHAMDLPASVHAEDRGRCACVHPFDDPDLHAGRNADFGFPRCGTVVFVRE